MRVTMSKEIFIGIDGGGTKTSTVAVDSNGQELARHTSPCSNYHSVGEDLAKAAINEGIKYVIRKVKETITDDDNKEVTVGSICLGMSGVDREKDKLLVKSWVTELLGESINYSIHNDAIVALSSGTQGKLFGVVIICGTGCISLGFNREGVSGRSGGWGPLLGDYGSGYQIGYDILRHVLKAKDQVGPKTSLTQVLLEKLQLTKEEDLISWAYDPKTQSWQKFAQLSPLAFEQAQLGDEISNLILVDAANALYDLINSVIKKLGLDKEEKFPLVYTGGNIERKGILSDLLSKKIMENYPNAEILNTTCDPSMGAALLALNSKK
ncbi:hypothetical protein DDB_G0284433 [Dictyostelium discoideum AX4]|nr:hypothetical protein DDB_G0284433 [Dictyostelium discoideum AX4]EAL65265.1 hypothetical protein DDB_G0284433 [Dictyostelium discoideum AX4]|eukprot:XP_638627.1 hypothetical protein DDB_G0284433 [Dictyostelium discoideum AX4]